jgi:hypothetical protein
LFVKPSRASSKLYLTVFAVVYHVGLCVDRCILSDLIDMFVMFEARRVIGVCAVDSLNQ